MSSSLGQTPTAYQAHSKPNPNFSSTATTTNLRRQLDFTGDSPSPRHRHQPHTDTRYSKIEEKGRKILELEQKTEIILRHNSHLLEENSELREALAVKQGEVATLKEQLQIILIQPRHPQPNNNFDRQFLSQQLQRKNYQHRIQIQKLLTQISCLHQQCFQLETLKNLQLHRLKSEFQQATYQQIQNLKRSQNGNNEMYEMQIRKLREQLEARNSEVEEMRRVGNRERELLKEEVGSLRADYRVLEKKRENQLMEARANAEEEVARATKQHKLNQQSLKHSHDLTLKKLRKDLCDKLLQIQRLNNRIQTSKDQTQSLSTQLKQQRQKLTEQLQKLGSDSLSKYKEQKARLQEIKKLEVENLVKAGENRERVLEMEVKRLMEVAEVKGGQLEEMRRRVEEMGRNGREEREGMERENTMLREKLFEVNQTHLQELELLKVKMSQLHQSDIKSLIALYESQIQSLSHSLTKSTSSLQSLRTQLHLQLQSKLHLRKQYQLQFSQLRSVISDLRLQLSAVQIQMKENMTSLRSKMEFASQSLLSDNQLKVANMKAFEEEMRKLRQAIEAKDEQLRQVQENQSKKEGFYRNQINRASQKNSQLRREMEEREGRRGKEVAGLKEEIDGLRKEVKEEKQHWGELVAAMKAKLAEAQDNIIKSQSANKDLQKKITSLQQKYKKLQHQLALAHGHIQTVRLQSQVNINDQKQRHKTSTKQTQSSLKDFYERKIRQLQTDKQQLTRINTVQSEQISELVRKYKQLERNLQDLMESQRKLTNLETRIINIGMDQNLVRNMAELMRR